MAKSRTKTKVEHLRGIIKQLKKEIRRKEKREHNYINLEEKEAEAALIAEAETKPTTSLCKQCNKGVLETFTLGVVSLITCSHCTWRQTKRRANEKI